MEKLFKQLTFLQFLYVIVTFGLFVFCLSNAPLISPDSQGYIEMDIIRSAGYSVFLNIHKLIFKNYYLNAVVISQLFFCLFSIFFLLKSLSQTLQYKKEYLFLIFLILCVPIIYEHKIANSILSEGLAYPLYLLAIGTFLQASILNKFKFFYFAAFITFLLIQVRGQFLFLIPLFLICFLLFEIKKLKAKKYIVLITLLTCIPFLSVFVDVLYHKIKHNQATTTPWTGVQIAAIPFFVSNKNDSLIFDEPNQKAYFNLIYSKLEQKKLLLKFIPKENYSTVDFYSERYVAIANGTINEEGEKFFKPSFSINEKTILNNKMASSMTLPLIKKNFFKFCKLYFQNVIKGIGTSKYFILIIILLILSVLKWYESNDKNAKFIIIGSLALLGNVFIVAFAEPTIIRYVFYNDWILIAIVLLLFQNTFSIKTND